MAFTAMFHVRTKKSTNDLVVENLLRKPNICIISIMFIYVNILHVTLKLSK